MDEGGEWNDGRAVSTAGEQRQQHQHKLEQSCPCAHLVRISPSHVDPLSPGSSASSERDGTASADDGTRSKRQKMVQTTTGDGGTGERKGRCMTRVSVIDQ